MAYQPLDGRELLAVNAFLGGASKPEAYLKGFNIAKRWKAETLEVKAIRFFASDRIVDLMHEIKHPETAQEKPAVLVRDDNTVSFRIASLEKTRASSGYVGRPTKYYPAIVDELLAYFDKEPFETMEYVNEKTGEVSYATITNCLPTLAGFAAKTKVCRDVLNTWARKVDADGFLVYPEFHAAMKLAKDFQEHILVSNTLNGEYSASFAAFTAKNLLGWKDKIETVVKDEKIPVGEVIQKEMTAEQAAIIYKESMGQD